MTDPLRQLLHTRPFLLADGGTGTGLFERGLATGDAPELWNLEHPEGVAEHHAGFVAAGSDIILTNTFGGNRYRLALHRAGERVASINQAAVGIARGAAEAAGRRVLVAGSMGPTGEILQPLGSLSAEAASAAFAEQARALAEAGADLLWIETMSAREEVRAALAGAARTGLPVVYTMSFDTNGRTMMGLAPAELAGLASGIAPAPVACGANCGVGAAELVVALLNMDAPAGTLLVAKANCGIPEYVDGSIVYNGTPALMADYARLAYAAGARVIGGCCGTTPAHIRAMRAALAELPPARPDVAEVVARLGGVSSGAEAQARGELDVAAGSASGAPRERRGRRTRRR